MTEGTRIFLGPCCSCECVGPRVRNVVMIDKRAVVAGHGWGCVVCDLPADGACYVQCDDCFDMQRPPKFACRRYPGTDGRIAIEMLTAPFAHDEEKHARAEALEAPAGISADEVEKFCRLLFSVARREGGK